MAWNEAGHAHELTFSCYRRMPLLDRDRTRSWLVEALDAARRRWDFELWAYVIMPEHVHILLRPRQSAYAIANILKAIKQPVSQQAVRWLRAHAPRWLDRIAVKWPGGRSEHRFWQQGGGYDRNIYQDGAAWAAVQYIHANPVRRGLVAKPTDWEWSSACWYAGMPSVKVEMDACPEWPSLARSGRRLPRM